MTKGKKENELCDLDCFECPYPDCKKARHVRDHEFAARSQEITQVRWGQISRDRRIKNGL